MLIIKLCLLLKPKSICPLFKYKWYIDKCNNLYIEKKNTNTTRLIDFRKRKMVFYSFIYSVRYTMTGIFWDLSNLYYKRFHGLKSDLQMFNLYHLANLRFRWFINRLICAKSCEPSMYGTCTVVCSFYATYSLS